MPKQTQRGVREAALIIFGTLAAYLLVALISYSHQDPAWSHSTTSEHIENNAGWVGAWFADIFLFLFGYLAYLFPLMVAGIGWHLYRQTPKTDEEQFNQSWLRFFGFILTLCSGTSLVALHLAVEPGVLPANSGGLLGDVISQGLTNVVHPLGASLFTLALLLTGISLATGLSWLQAIDNTGRLILQGINYLRNKWDDARAARKAKNQRKEVREKDQQQKQKRQMPTPVIAKPSKPVKAISERAQKEKQLPLFDQRNLNTLPGLNLLDQPEPHKHKMSSAALEAMARQVELKLKDFNIEVEVVAVYPGPVITRFELEPAPGVKGSAISNLAKDLARSLSVTSVRVVDVIPGKSVIGLEIPNEHREMVRLVEVIQSKEYEQAKSKLTLALGKDIGGYPYVADLAKMPHLLVAGTTGSGKSVAVNAMILSLLFNATAKDVRLIMIDPKMLELSVYEGIPHLLAPVVTDMKEAANALRWCVAEMERRYRLMAALGVRNIEGYNRKVTDAIKQGSPIIDPLHKPESGTEAEELTELPFIVVIIDELADMMMVVGKKVEDFIARLAQKARAAGIHLILATQRPSVDVLTGLIKSNIPTRIAFQVSTRIDSRTILDQMGAEHLLGHGDMLFLAPGTGLPVRVHGAFVDDHEVHKIVADLKRNGEPNYNEDILSDETSSMESIPGFSDDANEESDPLYDQAVAVVTETRKASISSVQRRLKIGYNRAARMIETMEAAGIVSPAQSNGSREVLAPPPPKD